jgi:D-glycero-alpha-D-manno-heptose-7-phosphate kinase
VNTAMQTTRPTQHVTLAKAPLRLSLAGGGTDLPSYADQFGGLVISLAINRYVCVAVHPRSFDGAVHASWEYTERTPTVEMLQNRFGRASLKRLGVTADLQIASFGDAPSGTGVGGSGAFTVALLHALHLRGGRQPDPVTVAEQASAVEMVDLERPVGKHDHYMAALGGLRLLHIERGGDVVAEELTLSPTLLDYFQERLLLFYTGQSRDAGQVLTAQARRTTAGVDDALRPLHAIRAITDPMLDAIKNDRVDDIGPLLDAHWQAKRQLGDGVTTERVDSLYRRAREHGADGGKLLGAGGGGFVLVSCRPGTQESVRAAMAGAGAAELRFAAETSGSSAVCMRL